MRTAIFIALVAMGISMAGCEWLSAKSKALTLFNIVGKWELDSLQPGHNYMSNFGWAAAATWMRNDSAKLTYTFSNDSLVTMVSSSKTDTAYYQLNTTEKAFVLRSDTSPFKYVFAMQSDSLFVLTGADSTVLWLRKQPAAKAVNK